MENNREKIENTELENKFYASREMYQNIPVPEEMKEKLQKAMEHAEADKQKKKGTGRVIRYRIGIAAVAAAILLVILPNTGADIAYAMGNLPVVGKLFQAVTFRDYQYESERFQANVEVPQIQVGDVKETEEDVSVPGMPEEEEFSAKLDETVEQINFDINEVTDKLIKEFQESADLGESHGGLEIHHETVTNNDRYFTLKISIFQVAGSGAQSFKFYTIDKQTGEQVKIGDLFQENSNYREILSEDIKNQMRTRMAEDENLIYWVDDEEMPELNWQGITEEQNFYFDEDGNIVVVFDEYEVAPGYMGACEFTVERELFDSLLK